MSVRRRRFRSKHRGRTVAVRDSVCRARGREGVMESDVLHVVSPYQERAPGRTPSKIVVSGNKSQSPNTENAGEICAPRVLDHETQIVVLGEFDGFLDITRRPGINADYRHIPLLTREPKGGVEVAALDSPVGKRVCLIVGVLGGTRLIGTPDAIEPVSTDIGAVSCGGVVAGCSRWDGVDERLGDFGGEILEFRVRWPTCRPESAAAVLGRYRPQGKSDSEEGGEEVHDRRVLLIEGFYTMNPTKVGGERSWKHADGLSL